MNPVWEKYPTLAWSNSKADDSTRIRCALLRPKFHRLLDLCIAFGIERVAKEWEILSRDELSEPEVKPVARAVRRILTNIQTGFQRAEA